MYCIFIFYTPLLFSLSLFICLYVFALSVLVFLLLSLFISSVHLQELYVRQAQSLGIQLWHNDDHHEYVVARELLLFYCQQVVSLKVFLHANTPTHGSINTTQAHCCETNVYEYTVACDLLLFYFQYLRTFFRAHTHTHTHTNT